MAPRPFPFPLHVGTDICRIARIFRFLDSPRANRFVERILTAEERAAAISSSKLPASFNDEILSHQRDASAQHDWATLKEKAPLLWKRATFVAGRFAAKEAAIKAHPFLSLTFHDVVIARQSQRSLTAEIQDVADEPQFQFGEAGETANGSGPPVAIVKGVDGKQVAHLSISHDGEYATATCLGFDPDANLPGR